MDWKEIIRFLGMLVLIVVIGRMITVCILTALYRVNLWYTDLRDRGKMKIGKFLIGPLEIMLTVSAVLEFNPVLQAIKIVQLRQAKDVSLWTFAMILAIGGMWLMYGIKIKSLPLIVGNAIKLVASSAVLLAYYLYAR